MQYASEVILADPEAVWDMGGRFPDWENRLRLASEGLLPPVLATFGKPDRLDRRVDVAKFYAQLVSHLDNTKPPSAHLTLTRPEENMVGPDQTIKALYALIRLSLERGEINQARAQSEMLPDRRARAIIGFLSDGLYASAVDTIIETRAYIEIPHLVSGQWLTRYLLAKGQLKPLIRLLADVESVFLAQASSSTIAPHIEAQCATMIEFLVVGYGALADLNAGKPEGEVYRGKAKLLGSITFRVGLDGRSDPLPEAFAYFLVPADRLDESAIKKCGKFMASGKVYLGASSDFDDAPDNAMERYEVRTRLYSSRTAAQWEVWIPQWFGAEDKSGVAKELRLAALCRGYSGDISGMDLLLAEARKFDYEDVIPEVAMAVACLKNEGAKIMSLVDSKQGGGVGAGYFILGWKLGLSADVDALNKIRPRILEEHGMRYLMAGFAVGAIEGRSPYAQKPAESPSAN